MNNIDNENNMTQIGNTSSNNNSSSTSSLANQNTMTSGNFYLKQLKVSSLNTILKLFFVVVPLSSYPTLKIRSNRV